MLVKYVARYDFSIILLSDIYIVLPYLDTEKLLRVCPITAVSLSLKMCLNCIHIGRRTRRTR